MATIAEAPRELVPVCPLERDHDMVDSSSSIDCWACDVIRSLYYIAIGTTDDPAWDARMTLDDNFEWQPRRA